MTLAGKTVLLNLRRSIRAGLLASSSVMSPHCLSCKSAPSDSGSGVLGVPKFPSGVQSTSAFAVGSRLTGVAVIEGILLWRDW